MALDNFRTQKFIWDRANRKIFETIEANSGDSNGRKLVVQVIDKGVTENLSGTTLSLGWKSGKGAKGLDAFKVVDASKGIFEIYYTTEMLSNIGNIKASLILIDSTSRIESDTFTISIRPSTVDDDSVESENSFTALTEALVKVNDLEGNYAPRLNEVTAQLEQNEKKIYTKPTNGLRPMVNFYLDDAYENDYTMALPETSSRNVPLNIGYINTSQLTKVQLNDLQNNHGWEIDSHFNRDVDLRTLSKEEQKQGFLSNIKKIESMGLKTPKNAMYPAGHSNKDTLDVVRELFRAGLGSEGWINYPPIDTYHLRRVYTDHNSMDSMKAIVDEINEKGVGFLVFYSHTNIWGSQPHLKDKFFEIMDYVISEGTKIATVSEILDVYENRLDIGNAKHDQSYFRVGADGTFKSTGLPIDFRGSEPDISTKLPTEFEHGFLTVNNYTSQNPSDIPFDSGIGVLTTQKLSTIPGNTDATQTFERRNGRRYTRTSVGIGNSWSGWSNEGLLNIEKTEPYTTTTPVTDFPNNKITVVSFLANENSGLPEGGIGTLVTSRIGSNAVTHFQTFYPYNKNNKIFRRTWDGSSWRSWSEFGAVEKISASHDFGEIEANGYKSYTFPATGLSQADVLSVTFISGIVGGLSYITYVQDGNNYVLRLFNHTGSPVNVGTRSFRVIVSKW